MIARPNDNTRRVACDLPKTNILEGEELVLAATAFQVDLGRVARCESLRVLNLGTFASDQPEIFLLPLVQ